MKLLYLIPGVGQGGGAERSLEAMVGHWTAQHDIHILTFSDRTALADGLSAKGARITNLGTLRRDQLVRALIHLVHEERPDLIHTTLLEADIAGRLAGSISRTPVSSSLVNVHYGPENLSRPGINAYKVRGWQAIEASTARLTVRFHALTEHVAATMSRRLLVPRHRMEVIPRGRDADGLGHLTSERRSEVRSKLGAASDRPLIVATARHEWQKGLDVLIRSIPRLRESLPEPMVLIGGREGASTAHLHSLAAGLGLSDVVSFIGQRDDVPDLMCAADAFVVPSRWEGFGSILVEAMCLGAPVVASNVGAIREVAGTPPWCRLFPAGDHVALADRIVETIGNRAESERLAEIARSRFEAGYTAERVAQRMLEFFDRAAGESRWSSRTRD